MQNSMIKIGKIGTAVGIKGEMRINLYAASSDNLRNGLEVELSFGKNTMKDVIENVRFQANKTVIRLAGVSDRTMAESMRDYEVAVAEDNLPGLDEGEFYVKDLHGYDVYDIASEQKIGQVGDYLQNRAQPLWVVEGADGKQVFIPDVDAFVKKIETSRRVIEVELIPGFIDEN